MSTDPATPRLNLLNLDRWGLRPYAKAIKGGITAVLTSIALLGLGRVGVDVSSEIIDLGEETQEVTWRQAVNAVAPLVAVFLTSNGPPILDEGEIDAELAQVPEETGRVDDPDAEEPVVGE